MGIGQHDFSCPSVPATGGGFAAAFAAIGISGSRSYKFDNPHWILSSDSKKEPAMHEVGDKTHWHEPTGIDRAGVGKFGRPKTPYDLFMESDGIPIFRDVGSRPCSICR